MTPSNSKSDVPPNLSKNSWLINPKSFILRKPKCVTTKLPLLLLTMAPVCAKPVSPEMTPQELSSPPSLDVPVTRVSWLAWAKKTPMWVMKLSPREEFLLLVALGASRKQDRASKCQVKDHCTHKYHVQSARSPTRMHMHILEHSSFSLLTILKLVFHPINLFQGERKAECWCGDGSSRLYPCSKFDMRFGLVINNHIHTLLHMYTGRDRSITFHSM